MLAYGGHKLHGLGKERRMQIGEAAFVDGTVEGVKVVGELYAVLLDDVRGSGDGRGGIVAVLCHFIACAGHDETCARGDVERVLLVASRTYDVDVLRSVEQGWYACFQNAVAEAEQLVNGDAAHLQSRQQGGYLFCWVLLLGDADEYVVHLLVSKFFVVENLCELLFHICCLVVRICCLR